jgi:hypothetical protein
VFAVVNERCGGSSTGIVGAKCTALLNKAQTFYNSYLMGVRDYDIFTDLNIN